MNDCRCRLLAGFAGLTAIIVLFSSPDFHARADDVDANLFQAGAFAMDISPTEFPVLVNGGMSSRTADKVVDPLHARCLVLDDGTARIAIIVVDSCMVPREILDDAKELASKATGIPTARMLISSTHTHQAPSVHGALGTDVDRHYAARLPALIAKGIQLADKNLQPARIGWAVGKDPNNVFCRRWLMKAGTARTNPFSGKKNDRAQMNPGHSSTNKIRRLGPVDDDVTVLSVQTRDGRPLAVLGNYSTHYAGGPSISADYFAVFAERIGKLIGAGQRAGPQFVGIMSNGTSGDANCYDFTRKTRRTFDRFTVADEVAKAAYEAYRSIQYYDWVPLVMAEALLPLKVRMPNEEEAEVAAKFLETPDGKKLRSIEAVYARETVLLRKMPPTRELKLQAVRIGPLGITAIPNEVYGITGLTLKRDSPLKPTFNISLANGCEGYIPPPDHHKLGGYTTWRARTSCLEEQAEPRIRQKLVELLTNVAAARAKEKPVRSRPPEVPSPVSPDESLKWLFPKPGMKVELVAAEPLVHDPVAFDWGPDGKLWVAEMRDYPSGLDGKGKPGGQIRFLEDTNGDGRYDKSTLFLDGIAFPTSVMAWKDGVLVTAAPEIFFAADRDGDGKSDDRKVLFAGFHEGNQQLRVNCLRMGLDNWVYCAVGSHRAGYGENKIKSMKSGEVVNLGSRDFRFLPNQGRLDPQSGPSQFGRNRDAWGNWFGVQNANPGWHYVLADHYLRRNPHFIPPDVTHRISDVPGSRPVFARSRGGKFFHASQVGRFTSANSAIIYRDELLGKEFAGNLFVSEPVHNLIHREIVSPSGVTFTSRRADDEQDREFLASADTWFRPTMLRTGPDGALWIADMYREIIEHPQWVKDNLKPIVDTRNGHNRGRIYRVYPDDKNPRPMPQLDKLKTEQLVAQLESPSGSRRDMAQRFIVTRKREDAADALTRLVADSAQPETRMQALWALAGLSKLDGELIKRALEDEHAGVRRQALRVCESAAVPFGEVKSALEKLLKDRDSSVRLQFACSLGSWDDPRAGHLLGELFLRDYDKPYIVAGIFSSLKKEYIADVVAAVLSKDRWQQTDGSNIGRLVVMAALLERPNVFLDAVEQVATERISKKSRAAQLCAMREVQDEWLRYPQLIPGTGLTNGPSEKQFLSIRNSQDRLLRLARTLAESDKTESNLRIEAIRFLGSSGAPEIGILSKLLLPHSKLGFQQAALDALRRCSEPEVAGTLVGYWKSYTPNVRNDVIDLLTSRTTWTAQLLAKMKAGEIKPSDISAPQRERLLKHKSPVLRKAFQTVFSGQAESNRKEILEKYRDSLSLDGDVTRGAATFKKHCAACHQLRGQGAEVGADLAALTDKSPENLLISILDPNRSVEPRFLSYSAVTKDGRLLDGMLIAESGGSITLLAADGKRHELLRSEIDELTSSGKSLMPEGLEKDLSPQDLADLFSLIGGE
jgi:putative membrane-bound dehydrogenase-like protein